MDFNDAFEIVIVFYNCEDQGFFWHKAWAFS